jgi:hypothetical protein
MAGEAGEERKLSGMVLPGRLCKRGSRKVHFVLLRFLA